MEKKFFSRNKIRLVLAIAASLFFITLAFSGTAPNPKKTYYLNIPTAAFTSCYPDSFPEAGELINDEYMTFYMNTPPLQRVTCPVYLPEGATITEFRIYGFDYSSGNNMNLLAQLHRKAINDPYGVYIALVSFASAGSSGSVQNASATSISNPIINNNYQYWITVQFTCTAQDYLLRFYGCRIAYTL